MTTASPPDQPVPLRPFAVAQDGTLHFTLHARDLAHTCVLLAELESTEAVAEVALPDGVHLTHITYGTVQDCDIQPIEGSSPTRIAESVPLPGLPAGVKRAPAAHTVPPSTPLPGPGRPRR